MLIETPKDYAPRGIKIAKIDDMSSEEFTETKEKFSKMGHFSASSTPGLLGLYGGPDRVFKQMRGVDVVDFSSPKIRFGQLVESYVANEASNMLDLDVFKEPWMLGSQQHSWMTATKDFHLCDNPYYEGVWAMEVKTTSSWGIRKQLGEHLSENTAKSYYIQSQHQMMVDELDGVINPVMIVHDESAIPWAVNEIEEGEPVEKVMEEVPYDIRCFVIHRNPETFEGIRKTLIQMRELYLRGDTPNGGEGENDVEITKVNATAEVLKKVELASEKRESARALLAEVKEIELELSELLGDDSALTREGVNIFSVRTIHSKRLDVKRFREEHPDMAEDYTTVTSSIRVSY